MLAPFSDPHRYFFPENKLGMQGFDLHNVHRKIRKNIKISKKFLKFCTTHFLSMTTTYSLEILQVTYYLKTKYPTKPVNQHRVPGFADFGFFFRL